jgi:polysaccharide export outer membrane protein
VLREVRALPEGNAFSLVCEGVCGHRLVWKDERLLAVQLLGTRSVVAAPAVPTPAGLVRSARVEEGASGTEVLFQLGAEARASSTAGGGEIEVRLEPAGPAAGAGAPAGSERPLGREDLIEISVFEIPELNRTVRVSDAGAMSLPLLGDIAVSGLTPGQLEDRLRSLLSEGYVRSPEVSVFVREHGSKKVSVIGSVGRPGVYEMLGPRTLLQVLAQAGGLTRDVGAVLHVVRALPDGRSLMLPVPVQELLAGADPSLNLAVEPGDVVSAPPDALHYIYVDGAVRTPGRIEQPASRPITLLQAIAKAGGATERANLRKVQILTIMGGGTQMGVTVNVRRVRRGAERDPLLRDGTVVVVPETFF